jgi:hypothetical protein
MIKGVSGIGKSALVVDVLERYGYVSSEDMDDHDEADSETEARPHYYKIEASMPLALKYKIIVRAFEEGALVVIDEADACSDDGLEPILNSVLTGRHPETGRPAARSGFGLVGTVNGAALEGRSVLSPALYQRARTQILERPTESEVAQILARKYFDVRERALALASDFVYLRRHNPQLNLRGLLGNLEKLKGLYQDIEPDVSMSAGAGVGSKRAVGLNGLLSHSVVAANASAGEAAGGSAENAASHEPVLKRARMR